MKRIEVSNKEIITAKIHSYFEKNEEAKFIHRLHGVLLFINKEEESCDSIGVLFGNSPRSVSNWVKKVNDTGDIESLRSKPQPGRPSRLDSNQKEELKNILQKSPEESDMPCNLWDGKSLSSYIKTRYGIDLKVRSCQRLFHELGFKLKRPRPVVARANEEKKIESKKTSRENEYRRV
jgi:Transposase and inactivated derivatives